MAYRDLELLAGDMRCLSVSLGAVNNEKFYITEMGYADFILRTDYGIQSSFGLYLEGGLLSYTVNEKFDKSGDFKFAFDWEIGYAEKIGDIGFLIGMHVVQLNSVQLSLGIGF